MQTVQQLYERNNFDDWSNRWWWFFSLRTWIKYWLNLSTLRNTNAELIKIFLDRSLAIKRIYWTFCYRKCTIVIKIHFAFTKKIIYIFCERITRNLRHHHFANFIDNFFTNSHFVKVFLIFNVDICDIVRDNAFDILLKLKKIIVATKSQLNLK